MRVLLLLLLLFGIAHADVISSYKLQMAGYELRRHRLDKALAYYQTIIKKDSSEYFNIGDMFYEKQQYLKALKSYTKISAHRLLPATYYNMANCYVKLGRLDEALSYYKKSLKLKYDKDAKINMQRVLAVLKKRIKIKIKLHVNETTKIRSGKNKINKTAKHSLKKPTDNGKSKKKKLISHGNAINLKAHKYTLNVKDKMLHVKLYEKDKMIKLQEIRWDKSIRRHGLQTLLIPLVKGAKDEQNNW